MASRGSGTPPPLPLPSSPSSSPKITETTATASTPTTAKTTTETTTTETTTTTKTKTKTKTNREEREDEESFLSRKKKEIVDRSMALFRLRLDRCLDHSISASSSSVSDGATAAAGASNPAAAAVGGRSGGAGGGVKKRVKRGREEDAADLAGVDEGVCLEGGEGKGVKGEGKAKKKRVNPREVKEDGGGGGKRFACPFCRHDPGKFRNVKTCCGPGWVDVHRVKEHVYRRHSLKNFCPRCFEHFEKPELLNSHQREAVPCELREKGSDVITEEQEKLLRARAKSHSSEEAKWEEMYRIIFPGEKVPLPYYDSETDPSAESENARLRREYLRDQIPRLVRPIMEQYAHSLLTEVQEKVNEKAIEVCRDVETKLLYMFHFQGEQASESSSGTATAALAPVFGFGQGKLPPSPARSSPEMAKVSQVLEGLKDDGFTSEICGSMSFNLDSLLAESQGLPCDGYSGEDSAYYTTSLSGEHGSFEIAYPLSQY